MEPLNRMYSVYGSHRVTNQTEESRKIEHQWEINGYVVRMFRDGIELKCETINPSQLPHKIISTKIIPLNGETIENRIDTLKTCVPIILKDGTLRFSYLYETWNLLDKRVSLLRGDALNFIWSIFNETTKETFYLPLNANTIPSRRCHAVTTSLIELIASQALTTEAIAALCQDFIVTGIISKEEFDQKTKELERAKKSYNESEKRKNWESAYAQCLLPTFLGGFSLVGVGSKFMSSAAPKIGSFVGRQAVGEVAERVARFCGESAALGFGTIIVFGACITARTIYKKGKQTSHGKEALEHQIKQRIPEKPKDDKEENQGITALLSKIEHQSPQKAIYIEIEPKSAVSHIDNRLRVSKFTWAVTIVAMQGILDNHAQMIIEGLTNEDFYSDSIPIGEYFMYKTHFEPPIKSHLYSISQYDSEVNKHPHMERTNVWMRPSERVIKMLREIQKNKQIKEQEGKFELSHFGSDSFFSQGKHSCFTWLKEQCTLIDIHLEKSDFRKIATITRLYTDSPSLHKKYPVIIQI